MFPKCTFACISFHCSLLEAFLPTISKEDVISFINCILEENGKKVFSNVLSGCIIKV